MKLLLPVASLCLVGYGLAHRQPQELTVIITGGARGHLTPCGCTKPMSGGIKRLATIIREERSRGPVAWIDTGDITDTPGRQTQMKVEAYSQLMGELGVDVVAYTSQDQKQGLGVLMAGTSLSKKKWLSPANESPGQTESTGHAGTLTVSAANEVSFQFQTEQESDILLFDGQANHLSESTKRHLLAIFKTDGIPTVNGNQVSPGSNLRGLVIAKFRDGAFVSARPLILEASIKDDPTASKVMDTYLRRVTQDRLIDQVPKDRSDDYVGSSNCKSCHTGIYKSFLKTHHSEAYQSLVKEGHQADPDCVTCHVVGLSSTKGFRFQKTPQFAQVGCESCHGSGREHAKAPKIVRLPKVEPSTCISCHTPTNSGSFNFQTYWMKIKH